MSPITFPLASTNYKNTTLFTPSSSRSQPMYFIETSSPSSSSSSASSSSSTSSDFIYTMPTRVYRRDPVGQDQLIATLDFTTDERMSDVVTIYGVRRALDEVFPSRGVSSFSRKMMTPQGEYKWRNWKGTPVLYDSRKRCVLKYGWNKLDSTGKSPVLEVEESMIPHLDLMVIGWIVMSRDIDEARYGGGRR